VQNLIKIDSAVHDLRMREKTRFCAVFLQRAAMLALAIAILSVCPSVCLYACHTPVLCQNDCM